MLFKCLVGSNYGSKGEVVDIEGLKHDALTERQKALLAPEESKKPRKVSSK